MDELAEKRRHLEDRLRELGSVAVAFSAGVDSTLLLKLAHMVLGEDAIAITGSSVSMPARELEAARAFCRAEGIAHYVLEHDQLAIPGFAENPQDRCYLCKYDLFEHLLSLASEQGVTYVIDGTNVDDTSDFRPGARALAELGIESPLRDTGFTKADIRALSNELGLPTWNKPALACLATRFPYGEQLTPEKLAAVEAAEAYLIDCGVEQVRVRVHGGLARIEVDSASMARLAAPTRAQEVSEHLHALGFSFVALDLDGYRRGSMN